MTPTDRINAILLAHGVSPDTVSLNGPRTLLGEELDRLLVESVENARVEAWHEGVAARIHMERVEAVEGQIDLSTWRAFDRIAGALRRYTWAAVRAALVELEQAGRAESGPEDTWRARMPKPTALAVPP